MDELKYILSAIDKKIDRIDNKLEKMEVIQDKQEANLAEHLYRTELAEENIEMLRGDIKPLEKHAYMINGGLKVLGAVSLIASLVKLLTLLF